MGVQLEKPTNEEEENNLPDKHFKKRIEKENIDDTFSVRELVHPTLGYIATLGWAGAHEGSKVRQPAIWIDGLVEKDYYISYEGYANYMDGTTIDQKHLVFPRNGKALQIKENACYFFNSYDPTSPNLNYSLDSNNTSIIMNNVSIYNKLFTDGVMINMRASFDGLIDDDEIGGNVNILCSVDNIG